LAFASVLVHEFGHAIAYRVFRQRPIVQITMVGGATHGERPLPRGRNIVVSLAGSVFAFGLLAVPAMYFRHHIEHDLGFVWIVHHFGWYWLAWTAAQINLWWSIFNLLPIVPLDGGHVSESLLGPFNALVVGTVAGAGMGMFALAHEQRYAGFALIALGIWNGMQAYRMKQGGGFVPRGYAPPQGPPPREPRPKRSKAPKVGRRGRKEPKAPKPPKAGGRRHGALAAVPDLPADQPTQPADARSTARLVALAWEALRAGDGESAELLVTSVGDNVRGAAPLYLRASVAATQGDRTRALQLFEDAFLSGPPPNLVAAGVVADQGLADDLAVRLLAKGPDGVEAAGTLATHLHYAGRYGEAARVGERVFADGRASRPQTAFEVACAWAQADDARRGLDWLTRAVDAGFTAPRLIDNEADLEPVRALPEYAALRDRLNS